MGDLGGSDRVPEEIRKCSWKQPNTWVDCLDAGVIFGASDDDSVIAQYGMAFCVKAGSQSRFTATRFSQEQGGGTLNDNSACVKDKRALMIEDSGQQHVG